MSSESAMEPEQTSLSDSEWLTIPGPAKLFFDVDIDVGVVVVVVVGGGDDDDCGGVKCDESTDITLSVLAVTECARDRELYELVSCRKFVNEILFCIIYKTLYLTWGIIP